MNMSPTSVRKITISLPNELVEFADRQAARDNVSRSQVISHSLAVVKAQEEALLAAEGYQFFAQESEEFAEMITAREAGYGRLAESQLYIPLGGLERGKCAR